MSNRSVAVGIDVVPVRSRPDEPARVIHRGSRIAAAAPRAKEFKRDGSGLLLRDDEVPPEDGVSAGEVPLLNRIPG